MIHRNVNVLVLTSDQSSALAALLYSIRGMSSNEVCGNHVLGLNEYESLVTLYENVCQ